jgi:DNA-3-methyladenine glycosylase I
MTPAAAQIERCPWPGIGDPHYAAYHDTEWGVPQRDDRALYEKLVLESFQSGLSWLTILKKRDAFRRAFHNFEPEAVANFTAADINRLLADTGIVRNRAKIEAAIRNARAVLDLQKQTTLSAWLWAFVDHAPVQSARQHLSDIPAKTDVSIRMAKDLKALGFVFLGPTTLYAFMQATGMVNDHLVACLRHAVCTRCADGANTGLDA